MTPDEMVRKFISDIEAARAALDDCPPGLVLHTPMFTRFLCVTRASGLRLGLPTADDLAVHSTFGRAQTMQRYWNGKLPAEQRDTHSVTITPRREAMTLHIQSMEAAVNAFLNHIGETE